MKTKTIKSPNMKPKASMGATKKTKSTTDIIFDEKTDTVSVINFDTTTVSSVGEKLSKLETAYIAAISGEIKFGEVKSIFKQLHKEIKKSAKSKS